MITVVLVVHLLLAVSLIGVVLLQKSEGGALGMGGGGMSGFMTGRTHRQSADAHDGGAGGGASSSPAIALAMLAANQRAPHSLESIKARRRVTRQPAPTPAAPAGRAARRRAAPCPPRRSPKYAELSAARNARRAVAFRCARRAVIL